MVAERRTITSQAEVIDLYGIGAWMRTDRPDAGLSLGWRHVTRIYPRNEHDSSLPEVQWRYGWLPRRGADPFFLASRSVGVGFATYPAMAVAHAGYRADYFTFAGKSDESRIVNFFYHPSEIEKARLTIHTVSAGVSR